MIWLLRDFDLLAVLLHAATLAAEALLVGGILFVCFIARDAKRSGLAGCRKLIFFSAIAMAMSEIASMAVSAAVLTQGGSGLALHDLFSASFMRAESVSVVLAVLLAFSLRMRSDRVALWLMLLCGLALVASTVWMSHATARMDHQALLALLTALHHLGAAGWVGAMPYLLLCLRSNQDSSVKEQMVRRFSVMAMISVAVLTGAGIGMSWFYVGSPSGLYATAYGLMLLAKIYLLVLMLILGGANWYLLRSASALPDSLVLRLRRFSEIEIGLGFTVLVATASLVSQAPAVDVTHDRVARADYVERMRPEWPRLKSPPITALAPPSAMGQAIQDQQFNGLSPSDANDMAWSEYNHHWAGLVVFAAGLLALLSQVTGHSPGEGPGRFSVWRWARYWPLAFLGLAVFILLRADPEAWPLGPRPFWETFSSPDVLEHRLAALFVALFAGFECAVQLGKVRALWASLVFPVMCALGAALLLTHGHESGNMKDEVLTDASHILIALLGATVGWARWLELRLPYSRARRIAGYVWPVALMLAATVLVDYREA